MSSSLSPDIVLQTSQLDTHLNKTHILFVFVGSEAAFREAHIPGSQHIKTSELVCGIAPAAGKIADADDLTLLFSRIGLNDNSIVIAYDDEGGGWAGRLIWTLDVIGHNNYHYLDGGLVAWLGENRETESGASKNNSVDSNDSSFIEVEIDTALIVTADNIIESLSNENFIVWDARSPQEYSGEKVLSARGGHIPGASNINWLELMDRNNFLRLKPLATIQAMLTDKNLTTDKTIVTHCQSHHRSGLTYLVGKIMGLNIKAYDGSWSEWGNLKNTPIDNSAS